MKNRSWIKWLFCVVVFCGSLCSVEARKEELTLLLVPQNSVAKQIGLDIAGRYPTLLVCYKKAPNGEVILQGWAKTKWVKISLSDYRAGKFFRKEPSATLIIEGKDVTIPSALIPPEAWCENVYKVSTTKVRTVLHLAGGFFNFSYKDWDWFAKRYRKNVDEINPEGRNMSWYHKRLGDHLRKETSTVSDDLQYWVVIRQQEEKNVSDTGAEEGIVTEDPFSADAPPAVIMGAGDVPEEESKKPRESAKQNQLE